MEYPFKDLLPLDEVLEREGYYKDWTHLDPEVFYSLTQISEYIKTKGYGVDVRLLIAQLAEHFSLKTSQIVDLANLLQENFENLEDVTQSFTDNINSLATQMQADKDAIVANATVDSEVILARGGKATLGARLDETTAQLAHTIKVVNVKEFGAVGDGVADDRYAIQSAIDSIENGVIFIPNGTYYLSDSLIVNKDNVTILGDGDTWLDCKDNHTINGLIRVQGEILSETIIDTDLTRGQTTPPVTVNSDYVIIKTAEKYNDERAYYRKGEIAKSENNLFIDQISDDYVALGNNLTLQEVKLLKNIEVKNIRLTKDFSTNSANSSKGIVFELVADSKIENIYGHHFDQSHVYIDRCYNVEGNFLKFEDGNKESGTCYGVSISNACRFININNITGKRMRHLTSFGCTGLGLPRFCSVNHANDSYSYAMSFDVHNIAEDITYNHCIGESIQAGGTRTTFNDCYFKAPIAGEPFYLRIPDTIDLSFNRCVFDGLIGTQNRTDASKKYEVSFNDCHLIIDDRGFASVSKFDNIKVNFSNTIIESHIEPILDGNNLVTNKKKVEFRFGENSVFNNNTFKNLIDALQIIGGDTIVDGNKFIDTFGYEITLNSVLNELKNIKINNNLFKTTSGVYSGSGRSVIRSVGVNAIKSLTISNNTIDTSQQLKKGITLDNTVGSIVTGNTIYSTGFGIDLTSTTNNNALTGNVITSDGNSIVDNGTNIVANNYERSPVG